MNYLPYNNSMYLSDLQAMKDRIESQIRQAQQNYQQTPNITQNFQLQSVSEIDGKYAKNYEEVKNTLALKKTLFIDNEAKTLWVKENDGTIKTYGLTEIIELDEKDKKIIELEKEIENLKGGISNAKSDNTNVNEPVAVKKSANIQSDKSNDELWNKS